MSCVDFSQPFAHGTPGLGLLLLRVVAGIAVVFQAATALWGDPSIGPTILYVLTGAVGILLLLGLWTPVAGTVLAVLASWSAFLHPGRVFELGPFRGSRCCFGLLGPGAWSVDAHLFGWKRVELPDRKS